MNHILSVLVENKPSVLSRVTGLISRHGIGLDDDGHARHRRVFGRSDGQRLDVEAAARDEPGHARKHAGLVLYENRRVFVRSFDKRSDGTDGNAGGADKDQPFSGPDKSARYFLQRRLQ